MDHSTLFEKRTIRLILKNIEIALTSKMYYFMDSPVRYRKDFKL